MFELLGDEAVVIMMVVMTHIVTISLTTLGPPGGYPSPNWQPPYSGYPGQGYPAVQMPGSFNTYNPYLAYPQQPQYPPQGQPYGQPYPYPQQHPPPPQAGYPYPGYPPQY